MAMQRKNLSVDAYRAHWATLLRNDCDTTACPMYWRGDRLISLYWFAKYTATIVARNVDWGPGACDMDWLGHLLLAICHWARTSDDETDFGPAVHDFPDTSAIPSDDHTTLVLDAAWLKSDWEAIQKESIRRRALSRFNVCDWFFRHVARLQVPEGAVLPDWVERLIREWADNYLLERQNAMDPWSSPHQP